ncbi:MAG: cytochrome c peroxidase [Planctomycetota bacterium]
MVFPKHVTTLLMTLTLGVIASCGGDSGTSPPTEGSAQKRAAAAPPSVANTPAKRASSVPLDHSMMVGMFGSDPATPKVRKRRAWAALGEKMYADTRLSKNGDVSCATCHDLTKYGQDGKKTPDGGRRNVPSTFNAARQFKQFWDCRAETPEQQAIISFTSVHENGLGDEANLVRVVAAIPEYVEAFGKEFSRDETPISAKNIGRAMGAFERTLVTRSRWDEYLDGDENALSDAERRGAKAFLETGCTACHLSRLAGGQMVQKLGLVEAVECEDQGVFEVSGKETDQYFFKVPLLLNVAETAPYMHDGSVATLEESVRYMAKVQLGRASISDAKVDDMVAFMKAMTGEIPAK